MKRSKKMFTRISSLLHNAVEALAPEMTLLEQFRYHWKSVTQFFLDTSDERLSVENTTIPHHMEQMLIVLQEEEMQTGTGPALEFMLQHKILETMQTLGRADCPPGMKRQVLHFFTNLLGKAKQKLLPHVNVHKPVNKLIRCCGEVKAAPTESEEVQFLLQVSSKLKQDYNLVNFFLEKPSVSDDSPPLLSSLMERSREKPEYCLVDSLLALTKSEDSRVAIKACEGLLLCTSIPEDHAASVIVLYTAFCERMADQLSKLFKCLPAIIDPADMNQLSTTWGFDHDDQMQPSFPGKRQMVAFLSWLDYVNQLSIEAHPMVAKALASSIRERFILTAIEPGLSQASEPCAVTVTAVLTRCLKLVTSSTLAQEFAAILLGDDMNPEIPDHQSPHKLRRLLIQRINHLSDQLAVETLRLFVAILQLSYQPIIETLIIRNFKHRNYLNSKKLKLDKSRSVSNTSNISNTSEKSSSESSSQFEDGYLDEDSKDSGVDNFDSSRSMVAQFQHGDRTCPKTNSQNELVEVNDKTPISKDFDSSDDYDAACFNESPYMKTFNKKKVEKTVNGFLLLVPNNLKSADTSNETGYDSYLKDAHRQCQQRAQQSSTYNWPSSNTMLEEYNEPADSPTFYEGLFLNTIFKRLQRMLDQTYDVNLEVTAILSLICQFRHPYLHEYLLDTSYLTKDGILTPHKILQKVCQELKARASRIPGFIDSLDALRRNLSGLEEHVEIPNEQFFKGVIILEEFCKELAAIAFVKATMDYNEDMLYL